MENIISALVVDDEKSTRQILTEYIDWKELGVNKIYGASDGRSALDIALSVKPQIIISDIKMPYMDGIEFAENIKEVIPDCKFIFLSGYPNKKYLKAAIKLKATSFIEKPIDLDEISKLVKTLVAECLEDIEQTKKDMSFSEQQLVFNTTSHICSEEVISALIRKKPHFANPKATFAVAIVNFNTKIDSPKFSNYMKIIENQFVRDKCITGIRNSKFFVIIHTLVDIDFSTFTKKLSTGINEISSVYKDSVLLASCDLPINSLSLLQESYNRAAEELSKCFFVGKNKLCISDNKTHSRYKLDESILDQFENAFTSDNKNMAEDVLQQLASTINNHQKTSPEYIKNIFYQLTFSLVNMMENRNLCFNFDSFRVLEAISKSETLEETIDTFSNAMKYCFECSHLADKKSSDPVLGINSFLQSNYKDPELNINYMAEVLNFDPSYLCHVFKKRTGKTINQYLTTLRIKKAKELLTFSNKKLYEIGNDIGYKNGKYFTRVFTKNTGISPTQYRERNTHND